MSASLRADNESHYSLLGVHPQASAQDIELAYNMTSPDDPNHLNITLAYRTLRNDEKRAFYDKYGPVEFKVRRARR